MELTARYTAAVEHARLAHQGVARKGTGVPYLAHVVMVSGLVLEHGGDEDQAIAGLLHDVAEDAGGAARLDDIAREFGQGVADIVRDCSDSLVADRSGKEAWWPRKVRYLDHLGRVGDRSLVVSAADKTHNCEAIVADYREHGEDLWSRFNPDAGRAGQMWYQRRVAEVLGGRPAVPPRLAVRLRAAIDELTDLVQARIGEAALAEDRATASEREAAARAGLALPAGAGWLRRRWRRTRRR